MPDALENNGAHFPQSEATTSLHSIFSRIRLSKIDNFEFSGHAENSLKCMETYFRDQQLTDVILVTGKRKRTSNF